MNIGSIADMVTYKSLNFISKSNKLMFSYFSQLHKDISLQ